MWVREDVIGKCKIFKKAVWRKGIRIYCTFFLLYLASFTLILIFLFYQNIEEFLLTREPLDIVRISTALFVQVEQGKWIGILEKEVKNFKNVLEQVLKQVLSEDIEWIKKLWSFGIKKKLAKRVRRSFCIINIWIWWHTFLGFLVWYNH